MDFVLSEIYEDGKKKGSGGIGRFFKNVGIRRSGKKYTYKKHEGEDFPCLFTENKFVFIVCN